VNHRLRDSCEMLYGSAGESTKALFHKGFSSFYALVTIYYTYPEPTPGRGRRPKRAEKHNKEPDFSRISSASLRFEQCYRETGDFVVCNYSGQPGLAGMSASRLANCTQQLGGLTPGIILRPTRQLLGVLSRRVGRRNFTSSRPQNRA
jgi:hypothetical protein